MDWDEMSNIYRGPSIDASYQVSIHLAEGFQRYSEAVASLFLAHIAKGNVNFCHHVASVIRHLSSVNFSHFNLLL
jgi:hypothetical protein